MAAKVGTPNGELEMNIQQSYDRARERLAELEQTIRVAFLMEYRDEGVTSVSVRYEPGKGPWLSVGIIKPCDLPDDYAGLPVYCEVVPRAQVAIGRREDGLPEDSAVPHWDDPHQ